MKAVNLIPSDQRGDARVGVGRSGGAAYALLVLLAAVALMAFLYGKANRQISNEKSEVVTLNAQAQSAQAQANELAPYTSFVALREQRAQAVATLVDSRFDWAHVFHEFGRVLSTKTSISSLSGTIGATAGASSASTTAATSSTSSATPPGSVPTFTLTGCATSQDAVAQMLQRLRLMDGVEEVTLQSSAKSGAGGASGGGGCAASDPVFNVGITFDPLPSTTAASAAAAASTVADKGTTTPTDGSAK